MPEARPQANLFVIPSDVPVRLGPRNLLLFWFLASLANIDPEGSGDSARHDKIFESAVALQCARSNERLRPASTFS